MPKLIENLEKKLLAETKRQIEDVGYGTMTVRSVAAACGVGVGTVYNYYPSKEALVAAYMLQDWRPCITRIRQTAKNALDAKEVVRCMYDQLRQFAAAHETVLGDTDAKRVFAQVSEGYHGLLCQQLTEPLVPFCPDAFTARFVAEALLTWSMEVASFEDLYGIIRKILK